jgi:hypothetical protein
VGEDGLQNPGMCRGATIGGMVSCGTGGRQTKYGTSLMAPVWEADAGSRVRPPPDLMGRGLPLPYPQLLLPMIALN